MLLTATPSKSYQRLTNSLFISLNSFKHLLSFILPILFMGAFIASSFSAISQDARKTVTGIVKGASGNPLSDVSVALKGTGFATTTDANGHFTISVPSAKSVLVFSYVGMTTQEQAVGNKTSINVSLVQETAAMQDVVVVGYGTKRKATVTGAISQVGEEAFKDRPVSNAAVALEGQVPGLTVTRTSARPGNEGLGISIRGASSVGAVDPLIIIDGVPVIGTWELNQLNPNDIESVNVLKDASAAIYGARAQGGVILVTTKRGKSGKMQVSLNSETRLNTIGITVPWANMSQWAALYLATSTSDKRDASGNPVEWFPQWTKANLQKMAADSSFDYTDPSGVVHHYGNNNWLDQLYGPAWSTQNDISIRGGSDKTAYRMSIGYANNRSLLKTAYDGEKKITLRFNYDYNISDRVKLETGISYDNRIVQSPKNGIGAGFFDAPVFPTYNSQGQYYDDYGYRNPVAATTSGGTFKNREGIARLNSRLTAEVVKGLKLTGSGAITKRDGWNTGYNQTYNLYNWLGTQITSVQYGPPNNPSINEAISNTMYYNYVLQADYTKTIARDHNIAVMVGNTAELNETKSVSATRSQLQYPGLYDLNTAISPSSVSYTASNSGGSSHWGLFSYIGRFNYDYKRKYLLELLGRRDGSSRFDEGYKWANFYGVSGGWRISQEAFMQNISFIRDLKLRASYGETGGLGGSGLLGNYDYLSLIGSGTALFGSTAALQNTGFLTGITTNVKSWERMVNKNIGLDFAVLSHLTGSFDVFEKKNIGMLIRLVYATVLGGSAPATNSGTLSTKGWELALNWKSKAGAVNYNVGFNLSNSKNEVLEYSGANTWAAGKYTTPRQGYPLNSLYVYKTAGYFQSQKDADAYFASYGASGNAAGYNGTTNTFHPGDLKVVDLDGDGKITATGTGLPGSGDAYFYGDADPHYLFGVNLGAQWNGFDFGAFIQGVAKWNILRGGNARAPFFRNYLNVNTSYIGKTWTPDNPNAEYPRLSFDAGINNWNWQYNDVNVQNLRYARLKSLVFGYTLPKKISSKISSDRIRFYFSGNDLFELTSVKDGFDPERGESADNTYPFFRTWAFGANITF
jgi:TonB-linked SusC/RagA family outer membrane protein